MSFILDFGKGEQLDRWSVILFGIIYMNLGIFKLLNVDLLLQEYAELMHEFMSAVKQIYGEKVLIQVS